MSSSNRLLYQTINLQFSWHISNSKFSKFSIFELKNRTESDDDVKENSSIKLDLW